MNVFQYSSKRASKNTELSPIVIETTRAFSKKGHKVLYQVSKQVIVLVQFGIIDVEPDHIAQQDVIVFS